MTSRNGDVSRRKFMATSLGCLATAGLAGMAPTLARADDKAPAEDASENGIIYRTLGRTGLKLPIVSMGAGACNDPALVQACFESGMRLFDTAGSYAYGRNEQMIGNALQRLKVRDKSLLVTKVLEPSQRNGSTPERQLEIVRQSLDGSLRRLKTDYIDILMLYDVRSPESIRDEGVLAAMSEIKKSGKVKFIGVSTHADMANVINASVEVGIYDVVLTSFNFTMATDTAMMNAVANAGSKGVGLIAMKVLAGGGRFPNPDSLREYDTSVINSAALKWVLRNENIGTAIPGIGNYDHMRADMAVAFDLELTEMEKRFLADNSITLGMGFCRQCSKCLATCPEGVDIPNLMRTHMYAAQYADFRLARRTIDEIPKRNGLQACTTCTACRAECANAVDIPRKIDELKLIYA